MAQPRVMVVGGSPTSIWGMTGAERVRRMAGKLKLAVDGPGAEADQGPRLLVDAAYAFDPPLLSHFAAKPGTALLKDGRPVIVHLAGPEGLEAVAAAMAEGKPLSAGLGLATVEHGPAFELYNNQLRKRETPFLLPIVPGNVRAIERASYFAAYKGVTDILTKYLWPEWALVLTRVAARLGISPNMVTSLGAALCVLATWLFWNGRYWEGIAAGLVFMVLDTVDGKLARCTITSSGWGNVFDHGIDLVHPPFWWWAWAVGLERWGLAYPPDRFATVMIAILGGYVVQRVIEGIFMRAFGMHIHVWERIDSRFRLITARRNPNMVILFFALLVGRPDVGLDLVAWWTVLSCAFHAVRLVQAFARRAAGGEIRSWLG